MKKEYVNASLEIVKLLGADIITTSGDPVNNNGDNDVDGKGTW